MGKHENVKEKNGEQRRSGIRIMKDLIGLVGPLLPVMLVAIILGVAGYLCAIFLTILASKMVLLGMAGEFEIIRRFGLILFGIAVLRGILHYIEQYCNHYIAFKLLAVIRHKVFAALRTLCPAKLEGRDRGNLISIITTDIELLEVFYAHTISPIAIAILTSGIMLCFMGQYHWCAVVWAFAAYMMVGLVIPLWNGKQGGSLGMEFRTKFGELNSFVLDSLRGLDETIQYHQGETRTHQMNERSMTLSRIQKTLSEKEGKQRAMTNTVILTASFGMLFLMLFLFQRQAVDFEGVLICTVAMMGSFGPVVALSSLSNNLNQTLASGERVLSILEETPLVKEVEEGVVICPEEGFCGAAAEHVTFAYEDEVILDDFSMKIQPGQIVGIHGASGSGKSTFLKLLMRFWDVDRGTITVSGHDVRNVETKSLRDTESYVTQETHLFHDSIANNIAIGKPGASREEIVEAAKKASIHEFIMTLPNGYDTMVGELGDTLSGGEKQRIGIARAFLHDAPFLLLDEPTSNLDSLNEGIILKSVKEASEHRTVVLVSHRRSTLNVASFAFQITK